MAINKHKNILDYTLQSLLRRKFKNTGIILVFTFIIFAVSSIILLSYSLKKEAGMLLKYSPEIIVQKILAGRHELISTKIKNEIMGIPGVSKVEPRYWGYYYDSGVRANYTIIGIGVSGIENNRLIKGRMPSANEKNAAAIGREIADARIIKKDIGDSLNLQNSEGRWMEFKIVGIFESDSEILTADLIIISESAFKSLVGMPEDTATDLAVRVANETEIPTAARKIKELFPYSRPILRDEVIRTYDAVFGWRSGLILAMFAGALAAFIILAWDKATGLSAEEKQEIGILKAIGWETSDILEMKFWEGLVISLTSFMCGLILAYLHIFLLDGFLFAPALKGWSVIYPHFNLAPFIDFYQIAILMAITVLPYIASTIIPSWKASITDPDTVMRG
ncbi:MAG: ABC transporter permease [Nitrospirae bacterium CG_4_10_14_3_um_filter_44_29]|nr:FtsX-like permease family protein [Nitrospirota bacterium]OIO29066.1 MAG: ABC transporter permease [Nitrospirae bacterium CG1_02_44_142]PIP70388.1 MAG: ABC transporter permease [Nitrospirae bacterium CG22_combo_CG10-13_8_21_14_all_44_11]PIV43077.1 MAG: ABC transporter permease [Nitrospirae bacterium CG02_land_8_20_14_3_00_44_33]PIW90706.1 MAG: ABC transporter permease [Nitrospirae bacterium CG_4_8_14_3_um_filter_44_28]PIX87930.1 MAG: ABC transporter permease [Nitrospirae bacterium CG_4_10_1